MPHLPTDVRGVERVDDRRVSAGSCMLSRAVAAGAIARPSMTRRRRSTTASCARRVAGFGRSWRGRHTSKRTARHVVEGRRKAGSGRFARRAQNEDSCARRCYRAKATIGSLKLDCADGIKARICEDVATRHIVSFISMVWSDA
jgi:hypothetical protein